jgi:hypothetical protein
MAARIQGLKRVNITIEGELHKLAKRRAKKDLKLPDGFSGYISRLIKLDLKRNRKRVAHIPRVLDAPKT